MFSVQSVLASTILLFIILQKGNCKAPLFFLMRSVKAFPLNQELATTATWLATFSVIALRSALVLASAAERLATWRVTARTLTAVWMTASATTAVAWATCLGTAPRATAPATGERGVSVGVCGQCVNLNSDQRSCVGSEWIWTVTSPAQGIACSDCMQT